MSPRRASPPSAETSAGRSAASNTRRGATGSVVLTIGHSSRSLAELIELLKENQAEGVEDVRTIPRSRSNPQFNREFLRRALETAGITYRHVPGLGGLRHARPGSPNMGWHNASFRGYADYMQTAEFAAALEALSERANGSRVALMCAEAVPWRCHRSLIADALSVRGFAIEHIIGHARTQPHVLTPWASVTGSAIVYPLAKAQRYEAAKSRLPKTGARRGRRPSKGGR